MGAVIDPPVRHWPKVLPEEANNIAIAMIGVIILFIQICLSFLDRVKRPSEEDWDHCCWLLQRIMKRWDIVIVVDRDSKDWTANKETVTVNFGCVYAWLLQILV